MENCSPQAGNQDHIGFTAQKSDWPNARFPENSYDKKVNELLNARPYKSVVSMSPDNDISNIKDMSRKEQYEMAEKSALNTIAVAEKALSKFPRLEKFLLLEYLPRADSHQLAELVDYTNFILREMAKKSEFRSKIEVKPLAKLNTCKITE